MADRVTQVAARTLGSAAPHERVTQTSARTLGSAAPQVRGTQISARLLASAPLEVRSTQLVVRVLSETQYVAPPEVPLLPTVHPVNHRGLFGLIDSTGELVGMTTITYRGTVTEVDSWPEAIYGAPEIVRAGTLIYLVSSEMVPTELRPIAGVSTSFGYSRNGHLRAYDGGIELSRGADYGSTAELLAVSPEPGHVRWYCAGPTYIRLGSEPVFDVRVEAVGHSIDGARPIDSSTFLAEAGITAVVNGRIPVDARFVDDPSVTYLDVLNDVCQIQAGFFGFNRLDEFEANYLRPPTGSPVYTFTENNILSVSRKVPDGVGQPLTKLAYSTGRTYPSSLATGVDERMRDLLERSPFLNSWTRVVGQAKHVLASEQVLEANAYVPVSVDDWDTLADRYFELFGRDREQITVVCRLDWDSLRLDLNDVIELRMARMGFASGKLFRLVVQKLDPVGRTCEFVLWG